MFTVQPLLTPFLRPNCADIQATKTMPSPPSLPSPSSPLTTTTKIRDNWPGPLYRALVYTHFITTYPGGSQLTSGTDPPDPELTDLNTLKVSSINKNIVYKHSMFFLFLCGGKMYCL